MYRKVIQHGESTLIISLPRKWIKFNKIEKGDELEVIETNQSVLIRKPQKSVPSEIEIDITGLDRTSIMYTIRGAYRVGRDILKIRFKETDTWYERKQQKINVLSVIHTEVNRLIGYEIIEESKNSCLIKDLSSDKEDDFEKILKRVFFMLKQSYKSFMDGVRDNDMNSLENVETNHDTATKFISYALRLINKDSGSITTMSNYYYHILATIDRMIDIIKYAARDVLKAKKEISKDSIKILEEIGQCLDDYHEFFLTGKKNLIVKINNSRYKIEREVKSFSNERSVFEMSVLASVFIMAEMLLDLIEARSAMS